MRVFCAAVGGERRFRKLEIDHPAHAINRVRFIRGKPDQSGIDSLSVEFVDKIAHAFRHIEAVEDIVFPRQWNLEHDVAPGMPGRADRILATLGGHHRAQLHFGFPGLCCNGHTRS